MSIDVDTKDLDLLDPDIRKRLGAPPISVERFTIFLIIQVLRKIESLNESANVPIVRNLTPEEIHGYCDHSGAVNEQNGICRYCGTHTW